MTKIERLKIEIFDLLVERTKAEALIQQINATIAKKQAEMEQPEESTDDN